MSEIETLEQAIEWCLAHDITVSFFDNETHIILMNGAYSGRGNTFFDAVVDAKTFLGNQGGQQ